MIRNSKRRSSARSLLALLVSSVVLSLIAAPALAGTARIKLVPGTAVLLSQTGGGTGPTSSTTSRTNIFSPAQYVDYNRRGGEPTVTVDRYPFAPGTFDCPSSALSPCPAKDVTYVSAPQGFAYPHFSMIWKSADLGQTFRLPEHFAGLGKPTTTGTGGGDTHTAVGQVSHKLFFIDLPADCVTMNVSQDFGETYTDDELGCGENPGGIDDRQWVDTDETLPANGGNVYVSFPNYSTEVAPTLSLARSLHDGAPGTFVTDSVCNTLTLAAGSMVTHDPLPTVSADDNDPTPCPDPADSNFWIAGPVVVDKYPTSHFQHRIYIPFVRSFNTTGAPAVTGGPPYKLYIAFSDDGATTWKRRCVLGCTPDQPPLVNNPANLFPEMTIDTAGNLYYVWSQTKGPDLVTGTFPPQSTANLGGETDVYYMFSTTGGATWSRPIPLTQEVGDAAVMPWMIAGDPGQVDLVFYKSNTRLNPNIAFFDANGNSCNPDTQTGCTQNPSVWNVFFSQSQNALNVGSNFKTVQISDHPVHLGQVCTAGLLCLTGGDRSLLDFMTVDVDHIGAATVSWTDTNNGGLDRRVKFSRQLSGNSVFKNQPINLQNSWPITDHSVTDIAGDVKNFNGDPKDTTVPTATNPCPGMDILGTSAARSGDLLTLSLTLNGPPTAANAVACSGVPEDIPQATGGLWGAEFWASAVPQTGGAGDSGPDNFYVAYRDNPPDYEGVPPGPAVEAGRMNSVNEFNTANEFHPLEQGTLGGNCFATPPPAGPCTLTMTVSLSGLLIKQGAGLYSITGVSVYQFGSGDRIPTQRRIEGHSGQADVATAFDVKGTGTSTK